MKFIIEKTDTVFITAMRKTLLVAIFSFLFVTFLLATRNVMSTQSETGVRDYKRSPTAHYVCRYGHDGEPGYCELREFLGQYFREYGNYLISGFIIAFIYPNKLMIITYISLLVLFFIFYRIEKKKIKLSNEIGSE